jgi:hypothetical protein
VAKIESHAEFESYPVREYDITAQPPAGRDIADLIVAGLTSLDLEMVGPVDQHESYGWDFRVGRERQVEWCMLQRSDHWLLICTPETSFWRRPDSADLRAFHLRVVGAIDRVLSSDPFSGLTWFHVGGE